VNASLASREFNVYSLAPGFVTDARERRDDVSHSSARARAFVRSTKRMTEPKSPSSEVRLEFNDRLRSLVDLAVSSDALKDASAVARAREALRTNAVPYTVAFEACAALRESNIKRDAYVRQALLMSPTKVHFMVNRAERALTAEEERERDEHRAFMDKLKRDLEEKEYNVMTRDVHANRGRSSDEDGKFSVDARAYGFAVHVLSLMFALVCAGYAVGTAIEQRYGGSWARGMCAALGASLALCVETGLFILRDARV